ncbi:alanine--tRNA ligase [Maribacter sp. PR1]|uniref:Alanine--tRNA ligase n=1 Tax=Maribacter cobaltidurans TaxID=1178778 RepID=A0ABU7IUH4_9FLAO|nr:MULTISPECIES: alanine--tRNA ligase [Maribacter]MDC6388797.1 alanine--tRNA ligase [Maribacter sp. PR1]MEE1976186.1 alanine--tRNA ligase [Maribacter cobaltidurans]
MNSKEIRKQFLAFFEGKKHKIVPSAPMVIKDDPTLLFTNAGMNQFKEFFLGVNTPKNSRVVDTQKCLRVSGKHNDLEEVGKDTYHHTMFEMLGNWSFGDYFKEEAITWAWELLTEVYKIDKDCLYVSVFEGSQDADRLDKDNEAYAIWNKIVPSDRIIMGNKKDNFWEMGDQGPCGPCSEIHVDIRSAEEKAKVSGASLVNQDHPLVVEIWNLVFMQYNRKADGSLESLPAKHVDTGMGFERLCMVLQNVKSNYDTDVFTPLIREIEIITDAQYGKNEEVDIAIRVIADHIRAVAFSIADGQLPSNTGAGYVIRRILRRAVRYGFTFLNTKEPFMYRLANVLTQSMGEAFPELREQKQLIKNVIKEEEHSFLKTLDQGLSRLSAMMDFSDGLKIEGDKVFELYDTYGFPLDLTQLIASENGISIDVEGFNKAMQEQKNRSKSAAEISKDDWIILHQYNGENFLGYDQLEVENVSIIKYRKIESKKDGTLFQFVLDKTPFYPEGGGQVGDKGYLESSDGDVVYIIDTKRENNEIIHFTKNLPKKLEGTFKAVVDSEQRRRTEANHTATHLLHQALREVLGTHVEQKGSAVHSKYLRFDFSHFSKMTKDELEAVESFVNARISGHLQLEEHRNVPVKEALEDGAMALFGEKYGDAVRTIRFGKSIELCGGTHVKNTSDIWHFKIRSEGAVAAGIRRIEAITSDAVKDFYAESNRSLNEITGVLGNPQDAVKAVTNLQDENAELKKQIATLLKDKAKNLKGDLQNELQEKNGVRFLVKKLDLDAAGIKDLSFEMGQNNSDLFLVFATEKEGKALLSCYISKELVASKGLNAGSIVRELGKFIQGGGGGQPFFATAGGKNPAGIPEALEKAKGYLG